MKVAKKSPFKSSLKSPSRATLTLARETYRKIDQLRGENSRAAWIQKLVEREEETRERERFAERLRQQYTDEVVRETLALHDEYPIHDQ